VSYSFRKGAESKYMRFGFIADELESVVPEVVRTVGNQQVADQKAVVYQDLIALLYAAAQSLAVKAQSQRQRIDTLAEGIEEVKVKLHTLAKAKPMKELNAVRLSNATSIEEQTLLDELRAQLSSERKALAALKSRLQAAKESRRSKERSSPTPARPPQGAFRLQATKEARWGKERNEASHGGTWASVLQRRRTAVQPP
jgi:hypothetical protein